MISLRCDIRNVDFHRASYLKHLTSKRHLEIEQNEMIIPEWIFKEPLENKINKLYNLQPLKQIASDKTKKDDKQYKKELARKMNNPFYFTDSALRVGFKVTLESHHNNRTNSKIFNGLNYPEFGIEVRYIIKIIKELSVIYARLINQYKINIQTVFLARFDKQDEENQALDETEFFFSSKNIQNLTETISITLMLNLN